MFNDPALAKDGFEWDIVDLQRIKQRNLLQREILAIQYYYKWAGVYFIILELFFLNRNLRKQLLMNDKVWLSQLI